MGKLNVSNRTLFTCDNLPVMQGINSETIDLIYLDPPFNSKRNYAAPIGSQAAGAAFTDTWSLDDIKKEWVEDIEADNKSTWAAIISAGHISGESMQAYLTYMAIRLIEMRRILKPTGSIYLHCDPTASHYLKLLIDAIFGAKNFRNEIVWRRTTAHSDSVRYGRNTDIILFYTKGDKRKWNPQHQPHDEKYKSRFRFKDPDGRLWTDDNLTAKGLSGGGYKYEYEGAISLWRVPIKTMKKLHIEGRLHFTSKGGIRLKRYLDETKGRPLQALWDDINPINSQSKERTGYPTQKPLALLERIISASSNPNDMVLDPFCGCATTCIAAEKLERQWIGIDIEPEARNLVIERLEKEIDREALFKAGGGVLPDVIHRKTPPKRTEKDAPRRSPNIKLKLYKLQEGRCNAPCGEDGQGRAFPIDIFQIDHIRPRSKGGPDVDENLQLLCPTCNGRKGNRTMQYWLDILSQESINV